MPDILTQWDRVSCGIELLDLWTGRLVSPVRTIPFLKLSKRIDHGWVIYLYREGISIYKPHVANYYRTREKAEAHAVRWSRAHWRSIPVA